MGFIFHILSQIIHWRHGWCSFIPSFLHYLFAFADLFVMEIRMNPFGWNTLNTHEIRYEQNTLNDGVDLWWFDYFPGFAQWSLLSLFNMNFLNSVFAFHTSGRAVTPWSTRQLQQWRWDKRRSWSSWQGVSCGRTRWEGCLPGLTDHQPPSSTFHNWFCCTQSV